MRVFKPQRLGLLTKTMPHDGAGLFVISTFTLFDLQNPEDILAETALWPLAAKELPKGAVFDAADPKPFGEFLVAGRAMAGEPVEAMHVAVSVADKSRYLSVFGDRYWQTGPDGPVFTQPVPFTEMPLTPDRAYGGEGYGPNPAGRGAHSADLYGQVPHLLLPNVEVAGAEIREIGDRPPPALVGALPLDDPARIALAGTYDNAWMAHRMPEWPEDFNPRYFMSAQRDQQFDGFFTGDEAVRVVGMSVRAPDLQSHLPGVRARAFVARASDGGELREVPLRTDTVWIFGSELKGVVVNRGAVRVADRDGCDVSDIMVGYEWQKDDPRPADYYAKVYALRTDPEEGYKYLLADGQLSPREDADEAGRRDRDRVEQAEARLEKWIESRQWRLERQFLDHGLPAALVPTVEEPDLKPFILPSREDLQRGDIDFARLISDAEDLKREAGLKAEMASAEIFGLNEQLGFASPVPPPASLAEMEAEGRAAETGKGYLPGFDEIVPQGPLDTLLEQFEKAPAAEAPVPVEADPEATFEAAKLRFLTIAAAGLFAPAKHMVGRMPAGPRREEDAGMQALPPSASVEEDIAEADTPPPDGQLDDFLAHAFPALGDAEGAAAPSARLKTALSGLRAAGEAVPDGAEAARGKLDEAEESIGDALTEARRTAAEPVAPLEPVGPRAAELFGAFVKSHRLEGGALAGRDLAGASLVAFVGEEADLTESFLETCDLSGAILRRAQCGNAVFTGAVLREADFSGAVLSGANLSKVKASGASFRNATFNRSTIIGADFSNCDFAGAVLETCTFIDCSLTGTTFSGVQMTDTSFVNSDLTGLKAGQLTLERSNFLSSALDGSDWSGARMKKASFANVTLRAARFSDTVLDECGWFGATEMTDAIFENVQAVNCGFQDAKLHRAGFLNAHFEKSNMSGTDLELADMRLSSWKGCMFVNARIRDADLFGANLLGASLHGADLSGSSFRSANLFRTDLSDTRLAFADFSGSNLELTNMEARL